MGKEVQSHKFWGSLRFRWETAVRNPLGRTAGTSKAEKAVIARLTLLHPHPLSSNWLKCPLLMEILFHSHFFKHLPPFFLHAGHLLCCLLLLSSFQPSFSWPSTPASWSFSHSISLLFLLLHLFLSSVYMSSDPGLGLGTLFCTAFCTLDHGSLISVNFDHSMIDLINL